MSDHNKPQNVDSPESAESDRRDFLKKATAVGMTAPAVAMLLSTEAKAQTAPGYNAPTPGPEPTPAPEPVP